MRAAHTTAACFALVGALAAGGTQAAEPAAPAPAASQPKATAFTAASQRYTVNSTDLPAAIAFDPFTPEEVARFSAETAKWGCGAWVFLPAGPNGDAPGAPVMATISQDARYSGPPGGLAKVNGVLWPVRFNPGGGTVGTVQGSRLFVGPMLPIRSFGDESSVARNPDNFPDAVQANIESTGGNLLKKRINCTIGKGKCRQYAVSYLSEWWPYGREAWKHQPVELKTPKLIIEDRCPYTRSAAIEHHSTKVGFIYNYNRRMNP